jgi:hypothetical protein
MIGFEDTCLQTITSTSQPVIRLLQNLKLKPQRPKIRSAQKFKADFATPKSPAVSKSQMLEEDDIVEEDDR